jgi:hypothetical protein
MQAGSLLVAEAVSDHGEVIAAVQSGEHVEGVFVGQADLVAVLGVGVATEEGDLWVLAAEDGERLRPEA